MIVVKLAFAMVSLFLTWCAMLFTFNAYRFSNFYPNAIPMFLGGIVAIVAALMFDTVAVLLLAA